MAVVLNCPKGMRWGKGGSMSGKVGSGELGGRQGRVTALPAG